jgi:hypothetical protein
MTAGRERAPLGSRLLRLAVRCPWCGLSPAIRITPDSRAQWGQYDPDHRVSTYQCQRRGCGRIYDLTARAYQEAA